MQKNLDSRRRQHHFIRNMRAMVYMEAFMVAAVATIVVIRLFLLLTGYPQIGNSQLHVAHVLFGGMFMMVALMTMLIFLGRKTRSSSAVVGGIGFGLFIDEVGKFLTKDNNYFFQPSIAIIYVTFMVIFLVVRHIITSYRFSESEYLTNAIYDMEQIPKGEFTKDEKEQTLFFLSHSGGGALVEELGRIVHKVETAPPRGPGFYERWKNKLFSWYREITLKRWFRPFILILLPVQLLVDIIIVVTLFLSEGVTAELGRLNFSDWAIVASNAASAFYIIWGIYLFRRSRLEAFGMFERSILVDIFIGQFFLFYKDQMSALSGFSFDLFMLFALRFIIERESHELYEKDIGTAGGTAGGTA
ncbi:MAG: hypothetical protein AAB281_06795 [Actinomycetota bacterium]